MKKFIIVVILILCAVFIFECRKAELIESLEAKIVSLDENVASLNQKNSDLIRQVESYEAMPTITPTPSPSPTPSPTPEPTPVPDPNEQIKDIVTSFEKASLPVENIIYYDETNDPNEQLGRPNCYIGKANFAHPASDEERPCTIEIFTNQKDLDSRESYILSIYDTFQFSRQYIYKEGLALFRLPYDILPSQAKEYEEIFREYWGS
jgi:hypothetical protein